MLANDDRQKTAEQVHLWERIVVSNNPVMPILFADELSETNMEGSVLHVAVRKNAEKFLTELLDADSLQGYRILGLSVDGRSAVGNTPLHIAAAMNHLGIIRQLLDAGAKPALQRTDGKTPEDVALGMGHSEAVSLLAE
jgi:ankyrin repeat domain-containing protein 6